MTTKDWDSSHLSKLTTKRRPGRARKNPNARPQVAISIELAERLDAIAVGARISRTKVVELFLWRAVEAGKCKIPLRPVWRAGQG